MLFLCVTCAAVKSSEAAANPDRHAACKVPSDPRLAALQHGVCSRAESSWDGAIPRERVVSQARLGLHVCLAGKEVSDDWKLIRRLRANYVVSVLWEADEIHQRPLLQSVDLLVLDCSGNASIAEVVPGQLMRRFPHLCLLLVDGGLSQQDIARAFQQGVKDYFAFPYDRRLLVGRIAALCERSLAPSTS